MKRALGPFQWELVGLPKWKGTEFLKSLLSKHQIPFAEVRKKEGQVFGLVSFQTEGEKEENRAKLKTALGEVCNGRIRIRDPKPSNLARDEGDKTPEDQSDGGNSVEEDGEQEGVGAEKKLRLETEGETATAPAVPRSVADNITPLWRMAYADQLAGKMTEMRKVLGKVAKHLLKEYIIKPEKAAQKLAQKEGKTTPNEKKPKEHLKNPFVKSQFGMICPLNQIVPSPMVDGYRNKCEFSVGYSSTGELTVGFLPGSFVDGYLNVETPDECKNVSPLHIFIAQALTRALKATGLAGYNKKTFEGVWRLITVRSSDRTKEVLVCIQLTPRGLTEQAIQEAEAMVTKSLSAETNDSAQFKDRFGEFTVSLLFQHYTGISNAAPADLPLRLAYGKDTMHEMLWNLRFRLSLSAFFQVNTLAAEKLYETIGDMAKVTPNTIVLDVCCGTGTIGIYLASRVKRVIGVDMVASAIEDAKLNAEANGLKNCTFLCGKAEDVMQPVITELLAEHDKTKADAETKEDLEIVAIVDPPRAGLHQEVLRLLRRTSAIGRLVYVSCNPAALPDQFGKLMRPSGGRDWTSKPFTAVAATPVDMFPHTEHCELVVLLERER